MESSKFWALRFAFYMMLEGESGNLFASASQSRAASVRQADKDLEEWTRRFPPVAKPVLGDDLCGDENVQFGRCARRKGHLSGVHSNVLASWPAPVLPVSVDDGRAEMHKLCGEIDPFLPFHSGCEAAAGHTFSHYSGARSWRNLTAPVDNRNKLCGVININGNRCELFDGHAGMHSNGLMGWDR